MKNLLLFILCVLLIACNSGKQKGDVPVLDIDPTSTLTIKMSDFIDSVHYIKLEFTLESSIRHVNKVFQVDSLLFIVDLMQTEIFVFNKSGKFLYKFNKKGRGYGEYITTGNVMFDSKNQRLIIHDNMSNKLMYYTLKGEFIKGTKDFSKGTIFRNMINLPNGGFLCYRYNLNKYTPLGKESLWEVDSLGNFVKSIWEADIIRPAMRVGAQGLRIADNKIRFMSIENINDYVYHDNEFKKVLSYNVEGRTANDFEVLNESDYLNYIKKGIFFTSRVETACESGYAFTWWLGPDRHVYSFYSQKDNKFVVGNKIDGRLSDSSVILPSSPSRSPEGTTKYRMTDNNIDGVMVVMSNVSSIEDQALLDQINVSRDEAIEMNPLLQLLYVKK